MNQHEKSSVQDNNYPPRSTSRQNIQDAQVFHDPTGIRRGVVNFVLPLTLIIAVLMTVFVSFYVRQIVDVRGSVGSVEVPLLKNTGISMLYTDNAPHSTAVIGDQIVKLDTLFMPRFLYKDGEFTVPDNYQNWDDFAKGVGIYRPVHHKLQYIFSAKDYGLMPTERVNFTEQENQDNRNITSAISIEKMRQLSEHVKKSKGDGLFIEVGLSVVDSVETAKKLSEWLASFKSVLGKDQLSLGIIYQANEVSDVTAPVLKSVSAHYVTFSIDSSVNDQIANLKKHDDQIVSDITYELPTVSTSENLDPFKKIHRLSYLC